MIVSLASHIFHMQRKAEKIEAKLHLVRYMYTNILSPVQIYESQMKWQDDSDNIKSMTKPNAYDVLYQEYRKIVVWHCVLRVRNITRCQCFQGRYQK